MIAPLVVAAVGLSAGVLEAWFSQSRRRASPAPRRFARVLSVEACSPTTVHVELAIEGDLAWAPGQFVQVCVDGDWRSYTLSHPDRPRLTVKRVPGGKVSAAIHGLSPGAMLELRGPFGSFGEGLPSAGRVLFIAGGSGVTPFPSLVRRAKGAGLDVVMLLANRAAHDAPLASDLREVQGLKLVEHVDELDGPLGPEVVERVLAPAPDGVWVCGPEGLSGLVERVVAARRPAIPVHVERFAAPGGGSEVETPVTFIAEGRPHRLTVLPGQRLLDALREAGVPVRTGCEQGACGACRVQVLSGRVDVPGASCLSEVDRARGQSLACIGKPTPGAVLEQRDE